jgi:excisionase family DNA binding protein
MSQQVQQLGANDLLTVSEVAKLLRVDSTTVRRWIKNGILEALSLPHVGARCAYRVKRSTVDKILVQSGHSQEVA